jgi:ankyrin repeat protein
LKDSRVDIYQKDKYDMTAMKRATIVGNSEAMEMLLGLGAKH